MYKNASTSHESYSLFSFSFFSKFFVYMPSDIFENKTTVLVQ